MKSKFTIVWDYRDIQRAGLEYGAALTKKQACEILADIAARYDACIGINYDVIDETICQYLKI